MLIPAVLLGSLLIFLIQLYIKESIEKENINLLKLLQSNVELVFNELDSINLHIISSAVEFVDLQKTLSKEWMDIKPEDHIKLASLKNMIDSPTIAQPYIDSIYIYIENPKKRFLTSTMGGIVNLTDYDDDSWYESYNKFGKEKSFWVERRTIERSPDISTSEKVEVISLYRQITLDNGSKGIIVLNLKSEYLNKELAALSQNKGQNLFIIDENNVVIYEKYNAPLRPSNIEKMVQYPESFFTMEISGELSVVFRLPPNKYNFIFASTMPEEALYEVPKDLIKFTFFVLALSIFVSIIYSFYLTKRNFNDLRSIIQVLQRVEKEEPLPHLPIQNNNVYNYIIHKILTSFMQHSYVKIQLSEKKYKMQALRLSAFQSQVNPHFLFNTLETINWKIMQVTKGPSELTKMIEDLGDILRFSLHTENKMVALREEIEYTKSYIDIQKIRYRNQFDVIWSVDKEYEKQLVVRLILQPLIENSIYHGVIDTKNICLIKVKVKVIQDVLHISVIDNGRGIEAERLEYIRNMLANELPTEHIGLYNTHSRLRLTYGSQYGITIKSKHGWGTSVVIKIPIK